MMSPPLAIVVIGAFSYGFVWFLATEAVMTFEDLEPRPQGGEALRALGREDLDLYAVDELHERIAALEAEIARSKAAIDGKSSKRSAADALFNFR
jgi:uncharacterized small protein (DUF1192 family)